MSLISIVITTYNQEKMILDCLNSLLRSQISDVELIVSDDCSPDNTYDVVQNWIDTNGNKFEKAVLVRQDINRGTVQNLISAINRSTSPYIKSIGGDDWFTDGAIDKIRDFIKTHDFDVAFSSLRIANQDHYGNIDISYEATPASKVEGFFSFNSQRQFKCLCKKNCLWAPAALYTRTYWDNVKLWELNLIILEDWAMWLLGTMNNMRFAEVQEILVVYRQHMGSVSYEIGPRKIQEMRDVVWVQRNICMRKKEWLSATEILHLRVSSVLIYIVSLLPLCVIAKIDKVRRIFKK